MIIIMNQKFLEKIRAQSNGRQKLQEHRQLFCQDDAVESMYLVDTGIIELTRFKQDGAAIVLQRALAGSVLAEASAYSETYHCDAIAKVASDVYVISKKEFLALLEDDQTAARQWAASLAREVQSTRSQVEILSQKTVAERLDHWLIWHGNNAPKRIPWKQVADQIGVSAEALYRELAKRRV